MRALQKQMLHYTKCLYQFYNMEIYSARSSQVYNQDAENRVRWIKSIETIWHVKD